MSNRADVSPGRGRLFNSLSAIFKKKDPNEPKATPMMLGKEANFKYDPIKKKYIFLDEPECDEDDVPKPPPIGYQNKEDKAAGVQPKATQPMQPLQALCQPAGHNSLARLKRSQTPTPAKSAPISPSPRPNDIRSRAEKQHVQPTTPENSLVSNRETVQPQKPQVQNRPTLQDNTIQLNDISFDQKEHVSQQPPEIVKLDSKCLAKEREQMELNLISSIKQMDFPKIPLRPLQFQLGSVLSTVANSHIQQLNSSYELQLHFPEAQLNSALPIPEQKYVKRILESYQEASTWAHQKELEHYIELQDLAVLQLAGYKQMANQLLEESQQNQELVDTLMNECVKKDSVISSQNTLIAEMISKLHEFKQYNETLKPQLESLKEDRAHLTRAKQVLQGDLFELQIELKNSRKEAEFYQQQLSLSQHEKESYVNYYEELKKEMQEDISNLNARLEESLNMSTTENQAAIIENQHLRQSLDVIQADHRLLESNLKNLQKQNEHLKTEMKSILEVDLRNLANQFNLDTGFINLSKAENMTLELRKVMFTLHKEVAKCLQQRETEHLKELERLRLQISSSQLKINQLNGQLQYCNSQIKQNQELYSENRNQLNRSMLEKDKKSLSLQQENKLIKDELEQLQQKLLQHQTQVVNSLSTLDHQAEDLAVGMSQEIGRLSQGNQLLEQTMKQINEYLQTKEDDAATIRKYQLENQQISHENNQLRKAQEARQIEYDQARHQIVQLEDDLATTIKQINQLNQKTTQLQAEQVLRQNEKDQSDQMIQELAQSLQQLTEMNSELQNKQSLSQTDIDLKVQQLEEQSNNIQQLTDRNLILTDQLQVIQQEFYSQKEHSERLEKELNQLNENFETEQLEKEDVVLALKNHNQEYNRLREQLDELLNQQPNVAPEDSDAINELRLKNTELQEQNSNLETLIGQLEGVLNELPQLKSELEQTQAELSQQQSEKASLTEQLEALTQQYHTLQQSLIQTESISDQLRRVNEELQHEVNAGAVELTNLHAALADQKIKFDELTNAHSSVQEMLYRVTIEKEQLVQNTENNQDSQELLETIEKQNQIIAELSEQVQSLQQRQKLYTIRPSQSTEDLAEQLQSLQGLYAQKIKQLTKLKQDLDQCADLQQKYDLLLLECESKEQQIEMILSEKTELLQQLDRTLNEIDQSTLLRQNKELTQRIADVEEQGATLKQNLQTIINDLNQEVARLNAELKETTNNLYQTTAQKEELKEQLSEFENQQKVSLFLIDQQQLQQQQQSAGMLTKFAGFFVTDSEMKKLGPKK